MLALTLVTPPIVEPVTLAEAKAWLRVDADNTLDDALILSLITACRQRAEDFTGRSLMTQQWAYSSDYFPSFHYDSLPGRHNNWWGITNAWFDSTAIYLPRGPLQSVNSITYLSDAMSTTSTLDPSMYIIDAASDPARVLPAYNTCWPTLFSIPNSVCVTFTAGSDSCPEVIKLAIKLWVAAFYENPSDFSSTGATSSLALGAQRLLQAHRILPYPFGHN